MGISFWNAPNLHYFRDHMGARTSGIRAISIVTLDGARKFLVRAAGGWQQAVSRWIKKIPGVCGRWLAASWLSVDMKNS